MISNKKLFLFILFFGIFLLRASFVLALEVTYPSIFGITITNESTFPEYARYFFTLGMSIAGFLAVSVIAFGAIYYLISFGRGKFTSESKEWIKAGLLGLFLIVTSYLIAYTINPDLVIFRLNKLMPAIFEDKSASVPSGLPFTYFNEIPMGTLTENLLSRKIDCYEYDSNGDPIPNQATTDDGQTLDAPTYLEHDRVDCLLKLAEAVKNKSEIIKNLSNKIAELMKQCQCSKDKGCKEAWAQGQCEFNQMLPPGGVCPEISPLQCPCQEGQVDEDGDGLCLNPEPGKPCPGQPDIHCSNANCGCESKCQDLCPEGSREKIEHGPIEVGISAQDRYKGCLWAGKEYKGLDEFRSDKAVEEKDVRINKINMKVIIMETWNNARLIDQLTFLKNKMEEMRLVLTRDLNNLYQGEDKIGQCYLVKPYVDFLRIKEQTNDKEKKIQKVKIFTDPYTKERVDISKYCKGFAYADSNCFTSCQKICPGGTPKDLECYGACPKCNPDDFKCKNDDADCQARWQKCLGEQKKCQEDCYNSRTCIGNVFTGFQECISSCKNRCSDICLLKYTKCPDEVKECEKTCKSDQRCKDACRSFCVDKFTKCSPEFKSCNEKCGNDSKCILENKASCLSTPDIEKCAQFASDPANLKNCIERTSLCTYGSDQYAGYPECLKANFIGGEYSSSFLYKNPGLQKCPEPYKTIKITDSAKASCVDLYPETAKCPPNSKCPNCPCDTVNATIQPSDENAEPIKITEYRVVAGQCGDYSFNDDPLTFYCKESWWDDATEKNEIPLGKSRSCPKNTEIPIGRTIDSAEKWGEDLATAISTFVKRAGFISQYIEMIGKEKGYCECGSECGDGKTACQAKCKYNKVITKNNYPPYEITGVRCFCEKQTCSGSPCQKMINLLLGKRAFEECPKGTQYRGVKYYYDIMNMALQDFINFNIIDPRSEVLKELVYSRNKADECSVSKAAYGKETKLLNCERAKDHIATGIVDSGVIFDGKLMKGQCYGKILGQILKTDKPLADNWYCCEEWQKGIEKPASQ